MASNPTTPLSSRKQFPSININSNGSPRIAAALNDASDGVEPLTRIPIARNGSMRRMRNSKSFSNDHQLSKSLTQAADHFYVSSLHKNDFLTLDKFGSAGSMHKAHNGGGGDHLINGDITDSAALAPLPSARHYHKLAPAAAPKTTTTNGKYCGAERSLVRTRSKLFCAHLRLYIDWRRWRVYSCAHAVLFLANIWQSQQFNFATATLCHVLRSLGSTDTRLKPA